MWIIIGATAIFAGICGAFSEDREQAIVEALFIVIIALVIILITSIVDYCKDKKFINLQSIVKDENITVIRGKFGATENINVWELVVGDIILIE